MKFIVIAPLLIPFLSALLLLAGRHKEGWQKGVSLLSAAGSLACSIFLIRQVDQSGVLVMQMGNWTPPFGIVLSIDMLSAIMILVSAVVSLTTLVYAFHSIGPDHRRGFFYALFQFQIFGINGAFTTGDLFNLFVFFEVVLMTSYVLLVLGNEQKQVRSGFQYLVLNLIGSTLFLAGAGILFGQLGTLNMADIAQRVAQTGNNGPVTMVAVIFLFVFGLKSAMFPVNNWLPDSYTAPPTPVSALFAGLLTKVGVYSMFRVFGMIFTHDIGLFHHSILVPLAGLTMILGVWGAVVQYDVRSILAYHSISQVGYILMGLAVYTPLGIAAGIFHMIHHSLVKSSLFLIGGGMEESAGSQNLKKIGGLMMGSLPLAAFFMISALALAGIPPLSGFYSKYGLVQAGLDEGRGLLVFSALITSVFTLYSMIKIWRLGFWGAERKVDRTAPPASPRALYFSCGLSVVFVVALSLMAGPLMALCKKAGDQIIEQRTYVRMVLSSRPVPYPGRN